MASKPMGREVRKTSLQPHCRLKNWRNRPNKPRPMRVPKRAATTGTAKARPRSSAGKTMARMALELAVTMAPPTPTRPLHRMSWVVEKEVAAMTLPPDRTMAPTK